MGEGVRSVGVGVRSGCGGAWGSEGGGVAAAPLRAAGARSAAMATA